MIQLFASIKLRLLAIFILLGLIPSLILFSLSYNIFSNYIKQNTKNNILEKNMRIKDQIESFYSERLGNIAILSGTELLANIFHHNNYRVYYDCRSQLPSSKENCRCAYS